MANSCKLSITWLFPLGADDVLILLPIIHCGARGGIIFEVPNLVQEPRDRFSEVQDLVQEPEDGFIEAPGLVQEPEDGAPGLVLELLVVDVHAPHSPSLVSSIVPWQGHEGTKVGFLH